MAKLNIEIGAIITPLIAAFNELKAQLAGLKTSVANAADGKEFGQMQQQIDALNAKIKSLEATVDKLNKTLKATETQISKTGKKEIISKGATNGINQANIALINTGRVLQDSAYGIIGIANNINPLVESFQRLRQETGSSSAAFKALGASLVGGGGLGLAFSAITAIASFASIGLQMWKLRTGEAKKETDEFAGAIKNLDTVAGEGAASVAGDVAKVNALAGVIMDGNRAYSERKRALEELREVNKAYFGDLRLEDSLTGKLTATVGEYTKALINNAIQKEYVSEIAKVAKAVADNDEQIVKSRSKVEKAQKNLDAATKRSKGGTTEEEISANAAEAAANIKLVNEAQDELNTANTKSTELLVQQALLTDRLNKAVIEGLKYKDLQGNTKSAETEVDLLSKRLDILEKIKQTTTETSKQTLLRGSSEDVQAVIDSLTDLELKIRDLKIQIALRDAKKNGINQEELAAQIDAIKKEAQTNIDTLVENQRLLVQLRTSLRVDLADINQKDITSKIADALKIGKITITLHEVRVKLLGEGKTLEIEGKEKIESDLNKQIEDLNKSLKNDLAVSLGEGLGDTISAALTGDDIGSALSSAVQNIMSIIGSAMVQLGKYVISAAIAIQALKKQVQTWAVANPALAIVAGIALVAAGTALKNVSVDIPEFAEGGIATKATLGIFGEAGTEAIIPLTKLPSLVNSIKGDESSNFNVSLGVKDRELVALIERTQKRYNRLK